MHMVSDRGAIVYGRRHHIRDDHLVKTRNVLSWDLALCSHVAIDGYTKIDLELWGLAVTSYTLRSLTFLSSINNVAFDSHHHEGDRVGRLHWLCVNLEVARTLILCSDYKVLVFSNHGLCLRFISLLYLSNHCES